MNDVAQQESHNAAVEILDRELVVKKQQSGLVASDRTKQCNAIIEKLEGKLLDLPQVDLPITHHFAPGVYIREGVLLKDHIYIGQAHKHEHLNVFMTGRATLYMDGECFDIVAPCIVKSAAGVRKILYIHEDLRGANIHATNTTDVCKLADELIEKSEIFKDHELEIAMAKIKSHRLPK